MIKTKSTLFISDLHLDKAQDKNYQQFLQLLNETQPPVDAVYILGDLFEAWIGDDHDLKEHPQIISALRSLTEKAVPVYFLHGNRDFLIGKEFFRQTGCQLLAQETKIQLYGQPVLIMHGDTLCTKDFAYIKARKKLRNPFLQAVFLMLPISLRKKIANEMRQKSMLHTSATSYEMMDVTPSEVMKVMQKHEVKFLIHGHTHRPAFHEVNSGQGKAERIVLGAWHDNGNVLVWEESGSKAFINLP